MDRRLLPHIDWLLLGSVLILTFVGLMTIYSVTWNIRTDQPGGEFWRQAYAFPVAIVALVVCVVVDYRTLAQRSPLIFVGVLLSLGAVLVFGTVVNGSRRWIDVGVGTLQPSEFARLGLTLMLAMIYGDARRSARSLGELMLGAGVLALPVGLVLLQPDLGTAVTLVPIYAGVAYMAGLRMRWVAAALVLAVLASPVVWMYGLHDYQKDRVLTFLDPYKDPRGDGYQQIQARVTVGSGGLVGKGFRQGTQGAYRFLPEGHNDFVFAVFAEEHGFLGVVVVLGLYLFVVLRSLDAAKLARDKVGAFIVVGLVSWFLFQVVYNITMQAGLAPVKGLTLPLMSYGGSSLVATLAGFGLILNVRMRRFTN
ncbi:MAG TPA: rod shape-determining protein RodA [Vicinamibacterales bacterium]|nr:rod shape-determining protein RodA [Vicinamibacterales bacterium]